MKTVMNELLNYHGGNAPARFFDTLYQLLRDTK